MVPAIGIPLERVVPDGGIQICGQYFKSGTVLGVNAWVVHRDREVYGADAARWRPGGWIEADWDKRREMERVLFAVSSVLFDQLVMAFREELTIYQFGGGSRFCLGRNISYLEMYKVIPELLTRFTVCQIKLPRLPVHVCAECLVF